MPTAATPAASDATFDVVLPVLKDVGGMFADAFVHLGGDEVDAACWEQSEDIRQWLADNDNLSTGGAQRKFVARASHALRSAGKTVVMWDEAFQVFGGRVGAGDDALHPDTVIQQWRWAGASLERTRAITSSGLRLLWSVDSTWYLDSIDTDWQAMYAADPCRGLSDQQCSRVLGGGGAMWGEHIDASNLIQTIFPRLAAIAEVLWSPQKPASLAADQGALAAVHARMRAFRCLLNARGVAAAPVDNKRAARAPPGPGSCLAQ